MANYNKVFLMGNLTRDVELRYTPSNQAVANLGLAVNRRYRTADGENREETTFVDCEAWGRTGETMGKYLKKGRPVFIEGRLKLDQWQDQEGNKRSKMRVVVENFQFIDSRGGGDGGGGGARQYNEGPANTGSGYSGSSAPAGEQQAPAQQAPAHQPITDDDIPF